MILSFLFYTDTGTVFEPFISLLYAWFLLDWSRDTGK